MISYTASQIAQAMGKPRETIRRALAKIPPSIKTIASGNLTDAWLFAALPVPIQLELAGIAGKHGYADPHALLSNPSARWTPPIPFAQANQEAQAYAYNLQNALKGFLPAKDRNDLSQAEFEAAGIAAYQAAFGYAVTGRWFRYLFTRTIERDNGNNDWTRIEIYLPDNVSAAPKAGANKSKFDHTPLGFRLVFQNPLKPTLVERQNALEYAFGHFERLTDEMPAKRLEIKQSVLGFLLSAAPSLAKSTSALKRNWDRKYEQWVKSKKPSAIADQRPISSGNFNLDNLESDLNAIVDEAWHLDGKLSIAVRNLRRAGKLSQTFIQRYTLDVRRDKSYVARSIRKEITARLTGMLAYRRGPWHVNMEGPRISRTHDYNVGDYFAADDVSFNIVWWYIDDSGRPAVTRGEVLLFFDCRSLYPLGYVFVPGHYNGETVRRGILHIHDRHGLPKRGFIFEKNIWESRLLTGTRPRDFLGWADYEMGLRERGVCLELRNVTTPGAKLIEVIFNIVQQQQRDVKGFVGFNEKEYGQERLQKFILRVKRGLVHPSTEFHSQDEWTRVLDQSLETYMHEPQNGLLLQGQSPAEMFAGHIVNKLPDNARFIISAYRSRVKVKANALTITIRGQRRCFYSEALGPYRGRYVYAWFNIEQPDLLTITDLDMKNPFSIKRHVLSAFNATPAQLEEVNRARGGFMKDAKMRVDQIKHPVRQSITRDDVVDEDAQALGAHILKETEQHEAEKKATKRSLSRLVRAADAAGVPLAGKIRNAERRLRGIQLLQESDAEIAQEENQKRNQKL